MHGCFALKSTGNGWNRLVMVTKDGLVVCASISEALGASEEMNLGRGPKGGILAYMCKLAGGVEMSCIEVF